jgi:hypothetical protein
MFMESFTREPEHKNRRSICSRVRQDRQRSRRSRLGASQAQYMLNPDGGSPFEQKHYLLVNMAMGGTAGGEPSSTSFPQAYDVDYVRVFQRN